MAGAAALSATAALRAGAGLVTLGCPVSLREGLEAKLTEVMVSALPECPPAQLARSALEPTLELAAGKDVLAVGPGLGRHAETRELVLEIVSQTSLPLILDADGLNALNEEISVLRARPAPTVLTPHPGEAARLLGISAAEINADRVGWARRLAQETECVVLLKGAGSVVAEPEGAALINPTGGAYLSMAGTGDVLTGMLAAFLAQGVAATQAAGLAAFLHGASADRLAVSRGTSGLLATEIADELPECMQHLREQRGHDESISIGSTLLHFPEP
jgi:NAD(P)H-hydrate epimerase